MLGTDEVRGSFSVSIDEDVGVVSIGSHENGLSINLLLGHVRAMSGELQ